MYSIQSKNKNLQIAYSIVYVLNLSYFDAVTSIEESKSIFFERVLNLNDQFSSIGTSVIIMIVERSAHPVLNLGGLCFFHFDYFVANQVHNMVQR
jgi:hypothetical protein